MPAGLGGGGWLAISLEAVMGTYQDPSTAGTVWVPILSEGLEYNEDKYFSPQIRQQTIVSDVAQSYYHVEGDIRMEVDPQFEPYFLHCSRHLITKTGTTPAITYKYVPSQAGSATTVASGAFSRTASITVVRNGIGFGYAGCVVRGYEYTLDNGVLMVTWRVIGLSEVDPTALGTPAWTNPNLFAAAAHSVYVAAAATSPTYAANDTNHNGFTFDVNFNGEAQNRIVPDRAATYISYGETEATYNTELDFINKTEYNNMKNNTTRALRLESLRGGASFALATQAHRINMNRTVYNTYPVALESMGGLIMAGVTGRVLGIAGGDPYSIEVKTATDIA
jgi:hypothetical protein